MDCLVCPCGNQAFGIFNNNAVRTFKSEFKFLMNTWLAEIHCYLFKMDHLPRGSVCLLLNTHLCGKMGIMCLSSSLNTVGWLPGGATVTAC